MDRTYTPLVRGRRLINLIALHLDDSLARRPDNNVGGCEMTNLKKTGRG